MYSVIVIRETNRPEVCANGAIKDTLSEARRFAQEMAAMFPVNRYEVVRIEAVSHGN